MIAATRPGVVHSHRNHDRHPIHFRKPLNGKSSARWRSVPTMARPARGANPVDRDARKHAPQGRGEHFVTPDAIRAPRGFSNNNPAPSRRTWPNAAMPASIWFSIHRSNPDVSAAVVRRRFPLPGPAQPQQRAGGPNPSQPKLQRRLPRWWPNCSTSCGRSSRALAKRIFSSSW